MLWIDTSLRLKEFNIADYMPIHKFSGQKRESVLGSKPLLVFQARNPAVAAVVADEVVVVFCLRPCTQGTIDADKLLGPTAEGNSLGIKRIPPNTNIMRVGCASARAMLPPESPLARDGPAGRCLRQRRQAEAHQEPADRLLRRAHSPEGAHRLVPERVALTCASPTS